MKSWGKYPNKSLEQMSHACFQNHPLVTGAWLIQSHFSFCPLHTAVGYSKMLNNQEKCTFNFSKWETKLITFYSKGNSLNILISKEHYKGLIFFVPYIYFLLAHRLKSSENSFLGSIFLFLYGVGSEFFLLPHLFTFISHNTFEDYGNAENKS